MNRELIAGHRARVPADTAPGVLGRVAAWTFRHRALTVAGWVAAVAVAIVASMTFAGRFTADYAAPGADSTQARDRLVREFPSAAASSIAVVARSTSGPVTTGQARSQVRQLLDDLARQPHVRQVSDPFSTPGGVSPDLSTAIATVQLDVVQSSDIPVPATTTLLGLADRASVDGLHVAMSGDAVSAAEAGPVGSEGLGLLAAAVVLLLTFGSVVAAGLPLSVALVGLGVSGALTALVARLMPVPDWSTSLATMIGLGVGIDYTLLMVTRFREWRAEGLDVQRATVATLDTAGRAVVLAGTTVVISMLGLVATGLSYMRGAAAASIVAVLVVLAAAITLFPALLGFVGAHVDRFRVPLPRRRRRPGATGAPSAPHGAVESERWWRWGRLVQRHRVLAAAVGVSALLALASPFLGARFGFPDARYDPADSSSHRAYTMTEQAFGPGANGPLLLAADITSSADEIALTSLAASLTHVLGVAAVSPVTLSPSHDAAVLTVVPTTGPEDPATQTLVRTLRDRVLPAATAGTGLSVHVGGVTAANIDTTDTIESKLPLLISGVVMLSGLLLLVAFRSVAVALKAAALNLLSVAAAYGVVALVLQGGWFGRLFGIDSFTPLPAFVPVLMFAVLFGLSMDYEVFLVSRMRETWTRTRDDGQAIVSGLAGTARVITAAAAIMIAVFAAFVPSDNLILKVIGIGMAAAILIDATVVRLVVVPAVMFILGDRNWWMPKALAFLPEVHVEGHPDQYRASADTHDGAADAAPELVS